MSRHLGEKTEITNLLWELGLDGDIPLGQGRGTQQATFVELPLFVRQDDALCIGAINLPDFRMLSLPGRGMLSLDRREATEFRIARESGRMIRIIVVAALLLAPSMGFAKPIDFPCFHPICPPPCPYSAFHLHCYGRAELFCHPLPRPGCYLPVCWPHPIPGCCHP
jgi:hypothetical protein